MYSTINCTCTYIIRFSQVDVAVLVVIELLMQRFNCFHTETIVHFGTFNVIGKTCPISWPTSTGTTWWIRKKHELKIAYSANFEIGVLHSNWNYNWKQYCRRIIQICIHSRKLNGDTSKIECVAIEIDNVRRNLIVLYLFLHSLFTGPSRVTQNLSRLVGMTSTHSQWAYAGISNQTAYRCSSLYIILNECSAVKLILESFTFSHAQSIREKNEATTARQWRQKWIIHAFIIIFVIQI